MQINFRKVRLKAVFTVFSHPFTVKITGWSPVGRAKLTLH